MRIQAYRALLLACSAMQLGVRPLGYYVRHRAALKLGLPQRSLRQPEAGTWPPAGPLLAAGSAPPPALPAEHRSALLAAAAARPASAAHGPFSAERHALSLNLFSPGDVRPVWEANRFSNLLLLTQAHRLAPQDGYLGRAEAWLAEWSAANPPFRGPNWACGQEAALRALHLATAHILAGGTSPPPGLRRILQAHATRIAATRAYATAQDNNHAISEPAGLFACALMLGNDPAAHAAALAAAVARLVAPDGGFAQVSTGYHRLLLDVLSVTEWLRLFHDSPPFPPPFAARAAAATLWLARLTDPETGALPRLGHQDGSCVADLSWCGGDDARGTVERAARLFLGASTGASDDPGCAWLGLPAAPPLRLPEGEWHAAGSRGWTRRGARALLRTGPLRFRPGQSDLLHLDLWHGPVNLLRDGGTVSYNPPASLLTVAGALGDAAAHNAVVFDDTEPMPRVGRFLRGRWLEGGNCPDGAWTRDRRGNRHARRVHLDERACTVIDEVSGPFRAAALRWRLPASEWRATDHGASSDLAHISVRADAPLCISLEASWEAPRYGELQETPSLLVEGSGSLRRITTEIRFS